jgi:hypothetical protein
MFLSSGGKVGKHLRSRFWTKDFHLPTEEDQVSNTFRSFRIIDEEKKSRISVILNFCLVGL